LRAFTRTTRKLSNSAEWVKPLVFYVRGHGRGGAVRGIVETWLEILFETVREHGSKAWSETSFETIVRSIAAEREYPLQARGRSAFAAGGVIVKNLSNRTRIAENEAKTL